MSQNHAAVPNISIARSILELLLTSDGIPQLDLLSQDTQIQQLPHRQ